MFTQGEYTEGFLLRMCGWKILSVLQYHQTSSTYCGKDRHRNEPAMWILKPQRVNLCSKNANLWITCIYIYSMKIFSSKFTPKSAQFGADLPAEMV